MSVTETTQGAGIELTETAAAKVAELLAQEGDERLALRVAVRPGGCSGFSYEMFFDAESDENDQLSDFERRARHRRRHLKAAARRRHP